MTRNLQNLRQKAPAVTLGAALSTIPALAVHAGDNSRTARAMITVPAPRTAHLFQLRGIGGRGTALFQIGGACHSMPVRLVAGDFEGRQTNLRNREPIVVEVRDPALVRALSRGVDIVSDDVTVSADPADRRASILLLSGLNKGTGFVINPGRSLVSDILGPRMSAVSCDVFRQAQTAIPED